MMVRTSKNKWKRFKKTLIIMEKKLWNSKTQLYGILHKKAQNWKEILEGKWIWIHVLSILFQVYINCNFLKVHKRYKDYVNKFCHEMKFDW
jgi:hypothetical protein